MGRGKDIFTFIRSPEIHRIENDNFTHFPGVFVKKACPKLTSLLYVTSITENKPPAAENSQETWYFHYREDVGMNQERKESLDVNTELKLVTSVFFWGKTEGWIDTQVEHVNSTYSRRNVLGLYLEDCKGL